MMVNALLILTGFLLSVVGFNLIFAGLGFGWFALGPELDLRALAYGFYALMIACGVASLLDQRGAR
jgi:hypothetical protein